MSTEDVISTVQIGHGVKTISVGKVSHGLMGMTWSTSPPTEEECFESIKTSLDMVPDGSKMILNSGEFYGTEPRTANLDLIASFFEKNPEYRKKAFLSVKKGGTKAESRVPDGSPENLKRSVDCVLEKLRGTKLDLFQCARVDPQRPVEDVIRVLAGFVAEGKFDYVGMSECRAETLRRGFAVHPIALVEIEVAPWSLDEEVQKVLDASAELGVGVAAYSPMGRGFLAGRFESAKELLDGDPRKDMDRYKEGNIESNKAIVDGLKAIAAAKGITAAQLCIAWVGALGEKVIPLPGSSIASRTKENTSAANIKLTSEDIKAVNNVLEANPVKGGRYWGGQSPADKILWG